ncbi:ImmA/IrrE family metallo-endopeptidase [Sphingomonas sp. Leaf28]|uniref:ImmA/IrrE family metallo-endopeptidase n=1 Tax=Sphingomonas sp. Leaf28 TaxID=1735695 RepID=UPI0006F8DF5F|nr:ImmA/IrrE family metallo-endopeptidase [Sphingomonas sp. Leaf28]KQN15613.1 hypothetical protein ASE79_02385 [Sphingomonas sp. Leaf28]
MSYLDATPSGLSKAQVYEVAESFAEQFGYKPGEDLPAFVRKLGGNVQIEDTLLSDPERSGSLYVEAPDEFKIILPAHTGRARDRFTIAHELGHYVLHYLWDPTRVGGRMMALRRGSDRLEWEANWFAAAFLMPAATFADAWKSGLDTGSIAQQFGVSAQAAELRAKTLGLS